MQTDNHEIDPVLTMLRSIQLEEVRDYLNRGRQLVDLATEELERCWINLMREWAKDFTGFVHTRRYREQLDIQSEFQLRGREYPAHLIEDVFEVLQTRARETSAEVARDPERTAVAEARLLKLLTEHTQSPDGLKH
jgi:hypothetical protein